MRIATWNINSVRLRAPLVRRVMDDHVPDIIALQETKTPDEYFPFETFHEAGYEHIHIHGMKGYNGVAIISKLPFEATDVHHRCGKEDCRHIAARFKDFELHNLYIPAGGYEPDPAEEKFAHKLAFVEEMTQWFAARYQPSDPLVALGDFNIAPLENDVWSHKQMINVVSHTPGEVERLGAMQASLNWTDVTRHFVPEEEQAFTWWSYRSPDWTKNNRGRRLDHIWVTEPLKPLLKGQEILREARSWEKPSDHVPLWIDLNL